jgi:hypothetical protein
VTKEIDKTIAAKAINFCQLRDSSRSHAEDITPITGAIRIDIVVVVVGSFAARKDQIM